MRKAREEEEKKGYWPKIHQDNFYPANNLLKLELISQFISSKQKLSGVYILFTKNLKEADIINKEIILTIIVKRLESNKKCSQNWENIILWEIYSPENNWKEPREFIDYTIKFIIIFSDVLVNSYDRY